MHPPTGLPQQLAGEETKTHFLGTAPYRTPVAHPRICPTSQALAPSSILPKPYVQFPRYSCFSLSFSPCSYFPFFSQSKNFFSLAALVVIAVTPSWPSLRCLPLRAAETRFPSAAAPDGRAGPGRSTQGQVRLAPQAPFPRLCLTCRINAVTQPPSSGSAAGGRLGCSGTRSLKHPRAALRPASSGGGRRGAQRPSQFCWRSQPRS